MYESNLKRILTWHVHGNYLYYLTQLPHQFYLPFDQANSPGYGGKSGPFAWGSNVHEVPVERVHDLDLDLIIFQSRNNYELDQYKILSAKQRKLPKVFIEHDPPREHPTDTIHPVTDGSTMLVHVTHFNQLMWDNGDQPTAVIEHGVKLLKPAVYRGDINKGLVVINNLVTRGRRLGLDIFEAMRQVIPLDLVGMGSKELGGLGEISPHLLPEFMSHYRFIFSPIRYTSLGLSLIEAMMVGVPLVGLATTELPSVITSSKDGFIHTDPQELIRSMKMLLKNKQLALTMSTSIKKLAKKRFSIGRFVRDWEELIAKVTAIPETQRAHNAALMTHFP